MNRSAVAATRREAIAVGDRVLDAGGNAVDAAIAVSFAMGVLEPYNNGIGGFGELVYRNPDGQCHVVDAAARVHKTARPDMFDVEGDPTGLYGWPAVRGNANTTGPLAACAPRLVAGLAEAHARFGTLSWDRLVRPAIELAVNGVEIDFMTAAVVAQEMPTLLKDPLGRAMYFDQGVPPRAPIDDQPLLLPNPALASALRLVAAHGSDAMRRGPLAKAMVSAVHPGGIETFGSEDLVETEAAVFESVAPLTSFRGWQIFGSPVASGATTAAQILGILDRYPRFEQLDGLDRYRVIAHASRIAFKDRLTQLTGSSEPAVLRALVTDQHLTECADATLDALRSGVPRHEPVATHRSTSTTHFSVIDEHGGAVSLTQTLLAFFGSQVGVPEGGFFLNNAMMWFDPSPGRANSIKPGARALSAVSPVIAVSPGGDQLLTVGAHGARRIITAVAQIVDAFVSLGLTPQRAVDRPRVHAEVSHAALDQRLPESLVETLRRDGMNAAFGHYGPTSLTSARAAAIHRDARGETRVGIDSRSMSSWMFGKEDENEP